MPSRNRRRRGSACGSTRTTLWLLAVAIGFSFTAPAASRSVALWDTGSAFGETVDASHRPEWKAVPTELFSFENDPAKASSDPGYYGREYAFKGDAVVENQTLTAVFWRRQGHVVLYTKSGGAQATDTLGQKFGELIPRSAHGAASRILRCDILRNAGDEVIMSAVFSTPDSTQLSATFAFGKNEIVEIQPAPETKGIRLVAPIAYGVVPGHIADDLIFGPVDSAAATLPVPAENMFLGLLTGEASAFTLTWPKGKQQVQLQFVRATSGLRDIAAVDIETDGQNLYVAGTGAPGLWHREALKPGLLEKDVPLAWKKPFPAKWKTQLTEGGVKTTFAFREGKGQIWRGVPGSYDYPAWFDGDQAFFHLSKKVPPKGESLIYFLEGQETPASVLTPVDVLKATLGRAEAGLILDPAGRRLRTHHRRGGESVHRACTCGYTEAMQAIFEAGQETTQREFIQNAVDDMNYFVERHVERINEYQRFAVDLAKFLQAQATATPAVKEFVDHLNAIGQQIPQEYQTQLPNMKSREHAQDLTRQTLELTRTSSTNNLAAYKELLKAWRAMGGAQDYVIAQCHTLTRKLSQEAGYRCGEDARWVPLAQEVRARCRQMLRNPDGYEIWADY